MATNETSCVNPQEKTQQNENYDSRLDFFSDNFDPLLALRTPNLIVPVPNATTYDNINKYQSVVERNQEIKKNKKKEEIVEEPIIERRWLPHQLPIQVKKKTNFKNVFTRMETIVGPLQRLKICKDKRHKIKVWTRHSHNIRGYCIAYLIAFDKHWNLALEDVEEVWTRPKKRKTPALDSANVNLRIKPKVLPPTITIISSTKKTETCSRHISQLLLRGEHIAYIAVIPDETKKANS